MIYKINDNDNATKATASCLLLFACASRINGKLLYIYKQLFVNVALLLSSFTTRTALYIHITSN